MKAIQSCCASYLFYITSCICSDLESLGSTCWLFLADTCIQRSPCKYSLVWNITCSWYSCSVQSITKWQSTHEELCWQSRVALLLLMERDIFCILTSFLWICNKIISFLLELHFKLFRKNFFFPSLCWWIWWEGLLTVFVQKNFNNCKLFLRCFLLMNPPDKYSSGVLLQYLSQSPYGNDGFLIFSKSLA